MQSKWCFSGEAFSFGREWRQAVMQKLKVLKKECSQRVKKEKANVGHR